MPPLLLIGAALGGAAMYFFDPEKGRQRRARIADKRTHVQAQVRDVVFKGRRDIANRAISISGRARSLFGGNEPSNRVLAERVRAKMGRYVAHPGAIDVTATRGCVVLTGSILAHEHQDLIDAIGDVPGVQDIYDRLSVFERAEGISELQGGRTRRERKASLPDNWSPAARLVTGAAGTLLSVNLLRGGVRGWLYGAAGAVLLFRAVTNQPLTRERVEELLHVSGRSEGANSGLEAASALTSEQRQSEPAA